MLYCFSYAVIAAGCASCPKIKCERPGCDSYFCYHCKAAWHPNQTCDSARAKRSSNIRTASIAFSIDSQSRKKRKQHLYYVCKTQCNKHTFQEKTLSRVLAARY